ncbi:hypothetical protein ACIBI9_64745 [Nonomuraea sp. NPDC050451]|uniref:hypothetical protein n=1 Tax=Nonomuraea sp. NPDC050451 TaxID=3364364 RepID=UPI0037ACF804
MLGDKHEASVLFIGNATTLIICNGFTILTDPTSCTAAGARTWATGSPANG